MHAGAGEMRSAEELLVLPPCEVLVDASQRDD
jgi:hypothetical protein